MSFKQNSQPYNGSKFQYTNFWINIIFRQGHLLTKLLSSGLTIKMITWTKKTSRRGNRWDFKLINGSVTFYSGVVFNDYSTYLAVWSPRFPSALFFQPFQPCKWCCLITLVENSNTISTLWHWDTYCLFSLENWIMIHSCIDFNSYRVNNEFYFRGTCP